jgi:hypothetical protein
MGQIEELEATRPLAPGIGSRSGGSGSGPMTSNLTYLLFGQAGSLFKGTAISNPFSDSHAISNLTQLTVNEPDRVDVSTYQEETTNRRLFLFLQRYQTC